MKGVGSEQILSREKNSITCVIAFLFDKHFYFYINDVIKIWCLLVLVLPVFIVFYGIEKCIREITGGSNMCYLTTNDLVYDRMK